MSKRWHGVAFVAAGVAVLASAVLLYAHRGYHTPTAAGIVPTARLAPATVAPAATSTSRAHRTTAPGARPTRVVISSIHVDAPVVTVGVHNDAIDVPADPQVLGWWAHGARAGASTGSVVVVGHVDSWQSGAGALFRLESVPMGAHATVDTPRGSVRYKIVGRRVYEKQALPSSVFATHGAPRLVLITCGGPFDSATRHYADNIVVYGVPITT